MMAWAKDNLSKDEITAYNNVMNTRVVADCQLLVKGLKARMDASAEPNLIRGKQSSSQEQFDSIAQITAAMKDPRYEKDPAYRKEVEQKIGRSDVY